MVCGKLVSRRRRRRRNRCAQVDNYKWVQFNQNIIRSHTLFRSLALLGFFLRFCCWRSRRSIDPPLYPSWFGCIGRSVAAQECAPWCFAIQNRSQLDLTNNYSKWSCFPSPTIELIVIKLWWSEYNTIRPPQGDWMAEMRSWTRRRRRNKFFTSLNRSSPKQNPSIDRSIKSIEIIIIIANY